MGKPGRQGAPSSVSPGDSATRQEVCHEGPPTRTLLGRISPGPIRWPPGAERRLVPAKSNPKPQTVPSLGRQGNSAGAPGLFRVDANTSCFRSEDATPGSRASVRVRALLSRNRRAGLPGVFWCT